MAAAGASIQVIGADYTKGDWGIPKDQFGFTATTSVTITNTIGSVEAKNRVGEVVAIVSYDKRAEVTVEGIGEPDSWGGSTDLGKDITLVGLGNPLLPSSSKIILQEATVTLSNEDWIKYSLKGNVYDLIT